MNAAWQDIIAELETERRRLVEEIVHYPPPIPRCDVQYNTLLEERAGIARELYRAEQISHEPAAPDDEAAVLEAFVRSSVYLSSDTRQAVLSPRNVPAQAAATNFV
jgi:hypothetical protein